MLRMAGKSSNIWNALFATEDMTMLLMPSSPNLSARARGCRSCCETFCVAEGRDPHRLTYIMMTAYSSLTASYQWNDERCGCYFRHDPRGEGAEVSEPYTLSGADISPDGGYRYCLWREWRGLESGKHWRWFDAVDGAGKRWGEPLSCVFVMLNPWTADGDKDDPTIRRCVQFAKRKGYDRIEVVNLLTPRN